MKLAGYEHLLAVSARQTWDPDQIELDTDRRSWPELDGGLRERLGRLLAGFRFAEGALATALERPVAGGLVARCIEAQAAEEERHARFFDRYAREVGVADAQPPAGVGQLFGGRLERTAAEVARDDEELFGLVHLVLEGVVLSAGQTGLIETLDATGAPLPGLREGVGQVIADERWHVGFGVRRLQDLDPPAEAMERMAAEGRQAAGAWGDAVPPGTAEHALAVHERRIRAAFRAR